MIAEPKPVAATITPDMNCVAARMAIEAAVKVSIFLRNPNPGGLLNCHLLDVTGSFVVATWIKNATKRITHSLAYATGPKFFFRTLLQFLSLVSQTQLDVTLNYYAQSAHRRHAPAYNTK
jgi:hypothetical protein